MAWMYAAACSSASGSPPSSPARSGAACQVRVTGAVDQEICRDFRVEHGNIQRLAGPVRVLAGDQHPPGPGRGQERRHRGQVRRVVEDQQPRRREPGQHRVHRRHRVPGIGQVPGAELGGQLAEPGRQHRGVLGGKLPRHPDLVQMTVGILHRHAGLPCSPQPIQGHRPRRGTITSRQPGIQLGEQRPPARPAAAAGAPAAPASPYPPAMLIHDLADSCPRTVGDH